MRKLVAGTFVTLDGVMQAPGGAGYSKPREAAPSWARTRVRASPTDGCGYGRRRMALCMMRLASSSVSASTRIPVVMPV